MTLPNFIIIGAAKSGTSSLYMYMKEHPEIYLSPIKEPHFFSFDSESKCTSGPGDSVPNAITELETYMKLFDGVSNEKAVGEASPTYLYRPEAPIRIHQMIPNAKLIAILRNPADRAFSAYMHAVRDQRETANDFRHALSLEEERKQKNWGPLWHYVSVGFYYQQLKRYYDLFGQKNIKVVLQEELEQNPSAVLKDIFLFLDVDPNFSPNLSIKYNVSGKQKNKLIHCFTKNIFDKPNPIRWISRKIVPESWRWKLTTSIHQKNIVRQTVPSDIRKELTATFREDIINLESLIGKSLRAWLE